MKKEFLKAKFFPSSAENFFVAVMIQIQTLPTRSNLQWQKKNAILRAKFGFYAKFFYF